jgi:hypothetical protein
MSAAVLVYFNLLNKFEGYFDPMFNKLVVVVVVVVSILLIGHKEAFVVTGA